LIEVLTYLRNVGEGVVRRTVRAFRTDAIS